MPIKFSELQKDERKLTVPWAGDEIIIRYRPSEWTPEIEDDLRAEQGSSAVLGVMSKLILEWDVLEDDDVPVALEIDRLKKFPSAFLLHLMFKIWEDMAPGEVKRPYVGG